MTKPIKGNQQQVWEEISQIWHKYRRNPLPEIVDFLKDKQGNILDLGCGSGRNLMHLDKKEYKFYCADFSKGMLKHAEEKCKKDKINAEFVVLDLENEKKFPFSDEFFDSVLFIRTLHCISGEKNRERILKELYRVMKKKSRAMIEVWNFESGTFKKHYKEKMKEGIVPWNLEGKPYDRYYYLYDKKEFESSLKKAGFKIVSFVEADNLIALVEKC